MSDTIYHVETRNSGYIPLFRKYQEFKLPLNGSGYLGGDFPDGITTIAGTPVSADVLVLLRNNINGFGAGSLVAHVKSKPDGTWRVESLPVNLSYDVVARYDGENDVIMSNVTPAIA